MQVQPYLMFNGRTEEALNFYKSKLGAEVSAMMRFKESPDQSMMPPGSGEKIMHSCFKIGDTQVMASDGECGGKTNFEGFSLALNAANAAEAERLFKGLSDGGKVTMPLTKTFFSPSFGMLHDRFGVSWMVVVPQQQ